MAEFPNGFSALTPNKTIKVFSDNGTANGWILLSDIIAQIKIADIYGELLKATDSLKTIASNVTSYELLPEDNGKVLRFLNSGGCTVLMPAGMIEGFACDWIARGTGTLTFQAKSGSGQTVDSVEGLRSGGTKGSGSILQDAPNLWLVSGYTVV